jgi:glutamate carboxypeptidase
MTAASGRPPRDILAASRSLLVDLCAISSESGNAEGIRRVALRLGRELERHGLAVQIVEEPDARGAPQPVLVARGPSTADGHLLLVGHLDTVLSARTPSLEGDRLVATGALDMKGGLAMLVGALDLLAAEGRKAPRDLLFVAVPDEESEGAISTAATRAWSVRARAVLVLEPGSARGEGETLVTGRRGLTEWTLEVTGRASHSGLAYWEGRSALGAAAEWCLAAQRLSAPGRGRTVNVARLVAGTGDFVDALAANAGLVGTSRQLNVVSDRAIAEGEVRYLTAAEGTAALAELSALADRLAAGHGVTARFTPGGSVPPVDPHGPGASVARRVVEAAAARGFRLEIEEDRGGISFPNFLADPGRIPVVDGLGPVGDGMHTRDEWLDLTSLDRRVVLLADLLATL